MAEKQIFNPPERWLKCPRKGKLIAERFIPFKTPLSSDYRDSVPDRDTFPPSMLASQPIGLVIDLTKSDRFYSPQELTDLNISYYKIACEGHEKPPTKKQTGTFIDCCNKYFEGDSPRAIGVHCTHGFNRTGFLIVSYLVQEFNWGLSAAIQAFSESRSPGIYKQDYITDLFKRYGDEDDVTIIAPERPEWCYAIETQVQVPLEFESNPQEDEENQQLGDVMEEVQTIVSLTPESDTNPLDIVTRCCQLCSPQNGYNLNFPGSQPVTLDHNRLSHLKLHPYRLSWKADGTRYMLYIRDKGYIYLIRRDNKVFPIPEIAFPSRKENDTNHVKDTLLDCEMVIETKGNGCKRACLLIYDLVAFGGDLQFGQRQHSVRMEILKHDIYIPREKAASSGTIDKLREPFSVRLKEFFSLNKTGTIFKDYIPKLQHKTDGLILSREDEGYTPGRCETLLKWKPPALNSIDFRLKILSVRAREGELGGKKYCLMVLADGSREETSFAEISPKDLKKDGFNPTEFDNKIIECNYMRVASGFEFKMLRQRTDKTKPNTYSTAHNVWESICKPLEIDELLAFIQSDSYSVKFGSKPNQLVQPTNSLIVPQSNSSDSLQQRREMNANSKRPSSTQESQQRKQTESKSKKQKFDC